MEQDDRRLHRRLVDGARGRVEEQIDRIPDEARIDEHFADRSLHYTKEALQEVLYGFRWRKRAFLALGLICAILGLTGLLYFVSRITDFVLGFSLAPDNGSFKGGIALMLLSLVPFAMAAGVGFWLYKSVVAMLGGKAVMLIRDMLVFIFPIKEDSRILGFIMKVGAKFIWKELEKEDKL